MEDDRGATLMTSFLDHPGPRWFTIPAHRPFLEDLATGVIRALPPSDPAALADAVILLPTRRAARVLAEAFLSVGDERAVLLPQIRALGDLEEGEAPFEPGDLALDLPPAISPWRRRFELARLVVENEHLLERRLDAAAALELADALAVFLDACQIEETGDPRAVEALVEGELARHWQASARFLNLALEVWPRSPGGRSAWSTSPRGACMLLRRLAQAWRERPTDQVILAAGSTGSAPAAADLLDGDRRRAARRRRACRAWTSPWPTRPGPASTNSIRRAASSDCSIASPWPATRSPTGIPPPERAASAAAGAGA